MGIQINGNTNNINAGIGSLSIEDINELDIVGVATAANFKTGVSNLHNVGLTLSGGQIDVGSNIKIGTAGVITATSFVGSGANLTGITQTTINNNADNRIITGSGTANTLEAESVLTFDNSTHTLTVHQTDTGNNPAFKSIHRGSAGSQINAHFTNYSGTNHTVILHDGSVGIGTQSPAAPLHVSKSYTAPTGGIDGNTCLLLSNSGGSAYAGLAIQGTTSGGSYIHLGDTDDINVGNILYDHPSNSMQFITNASERLRIGSSGQIGLAGANYGTARQTIVSNGSGSAVTWSSNPFVIDMVGLGDIDYGKMFVRYRETATVSGNGLIYLGICKSTTNCPAGRAGTPIGFIPSTAFNGHFRVDKIGITPWPDGSGHRYEYYAIISDYVSSGKLGVFYLTNTTS